ncbi:MAG TPA: Maf family protein [Steroidobacteraceae bacterium]|nr:Maf family protein [Steroidobacteraceae bacterium]
MPSALPVILASTSRYRRALLERLLPAFEIHRPEVDEAPLAGEGPARRALRLAEAKAQAVARRYPEALVIGSDQVASAAGAVLHKPGTAEGARAQLQGLSGRSAEFFTACALVHAGAGRRSMHLDTTRVAFRTLEAQEIARYVERDQPLDCAGSFKSESLGISLLQRIESEDPTALIGLPLVWLAGALRSFGCPVP